MPVTQTREIAPAQRLENLRYAIRDLVSLADEVKRQGHKVLYLNVGDPNIFDFAPPAHVIEAAYRAMRDNKNGYAPSAVKQKRTVSLPCRMFSSQMAPVKRLTSA